MGVLKSPGKVVEWIFLSVKEWEPCCLSVCLFVRLSVCLPVCLYVSVFVYVCFSVCVCLSVCLCVCVCVRPGVGSFTIVDGQSVSGDDAGNKLVIATLVTTNQSDGNNINANRPSAVPVLGSHHVSTHTCDILVANFTLISANLVPHFGNFF